MRSTRSQSSRSRRRGATAPSTTPSGWQLEAGVKQLALFHHDPSRRDDDLDVLLRCAVEAGCPHGRGCDRRLRRARRRTRLAWLGDRRCQRRCLARCSSSPGSPSSPRLQQWRTQAAELGVPGFSRRVCCRIVELGVGALLVAQIARRPWPSLPVSLLVAFTALLVVRLAQGRRPPCACFGGLSSKPIGWSNVARNARVHRCWPDDA